MYLYKMPGVATGKAKLERLQEERAKNVIKHWDLKRAVPFQLHKGWRPPHSP